MKYRVDIDGLRALAVLGVILFHAFPSVLQGGFVGVDVFFVISGYLISGIILEQQAQGAFSIRDFYARRVRRIFPALIVVLTAAIAAGWAILFNDEFALIGRQVAAGAGFAANVLFWREAGYFDQTAELKPLLHLWSLGVEEQFYFIWPFLILASGSSRSRLTAMFGVVFAASMLLNLLMVRHYGEATFYLPFSRLWEFIAGAAILVLKDFRQPHGIAKLLEVHHAGMRHVASVAGFLALACAMWIFKSHMHYPGRAALIPVLGTVLLIAAGPDGLINKMLLKQPPVAWIGLISYPLYLWHWPLISFLHIMNVTSPWIFAASLMVSVMLAAMTYVFVEKPLRRKSAAAVSPGLGLACAALLVTGMLCYTGVIQPRLNGPAFGNAVKARNDWSWPPPVMKKSDFAQTDVFVLKGTNPDEVLYIGDSNMQQYAVRVAAVIQSGKPAYTAAFLTQSGCRPIPNVTRENQDDCLDVKSDVLRYIGSHRVRRVVIGGRWNPSFFTAELYYRFAKDNVVPLTDVRARNAAVASFKDFVVMIRAHHIDVSILQNIPTGFNGLEMPGMDGIRLASNTEVGRIFASFNPRIARSGVVNEAGRRIIDDIAVSTGSRVIDPIPALCGPAWCQLLYDGNRFIYKDDKHLTAGYAAKYASFMDDTILIP